MVNLSTILDADRVRQHLWTAVRILIVIPLTAIVIVWLVCLVVDDLASWAAASAIDGNLV